MTNREVELIKNIRKIMPDANKATEFILNVAKFYEYKLSSAYLDALEAAVESVVVDD